MQVYVNRRVEVNRLSASEIERSVVRVDVVEADVLEVAVFDGRLHGAVTLIMTADALSASDIEKAAVKPPFVLMSLKWMSLKLLLSICDFTTPCSSPPPTP
jgi:hypothetical protein